MNKQLIERLVVVYENLRTLEGDLIRINGKFPYEPALVYKFGVELDVLETLIDGFKREIKQ